MSGEPGESGEPGQAVRVAVHGRQPRTRANGPGVRFAVWFQGCSLGCPGCFNPDTHALASSAEAPADASTTTVDALLAEILAQGERIQGVTLSGGEPLEQPEAALALVRAIRRESALSILVFSGFTIEEIREQPLGPALLAEIDVLIDGRYQAPERTAEKLRGSANQRVHLLTDRYQAHEVEATPEAEIVIDAHGNITMSGVAPIIKLGRGRSSG